MAQQINIANTPRNKSFCISILILIFFVGVSSSQLASYFSYNHSEAEDNEVVSIQNFKKQFNVGRKSTVPSYSKFFLPTLNLSNSGSLLAVDCFSLGGSCGSGLNPISYGLSTTLETRIFASILPSYITKYKNLVEKCFNTQFDGFVLYKLNFLKIGAYRLGMFAKTTVLNVESVCGIIRKRSASLFGEVLNLIPRDLKEINNQANKSYSFEFALNKITKANASIFLDRV